MKDINARIIATEFVGMVADKLDPAEKRQIGQAIYERLVALQKSYRQAAEKAARFDDAYQQQALGAAEYEKIQVAFAASGVPDAANRLNAHLARHLQGVVLSQLDREFSLVAGEK